MRSQTHITWLIESKTFMWSLEFKSMLWYFITCLGVCSLTHLSLEKRCVFVDLCGSLRHSSHIDEIQSTVRLIKKGLIILMQVHNIFCFSLAGIISFYSHYPPPEFSSFNLSHTAMPSIFLFQLGQNK